jgi:polyferredoxin
MDKWKGRLWLAVYILTLCFTYIFIITLVPWAKQNDMVTGIIIGSGIGGIIGFFYGSSDKKGKEEGEK